MLTRAHQLAHAADAHVFFREREAVRDPRQERQALQARLRRIRGQEKAPARRRTSPHAPSKLVQLRQSEAFRSLDHHHGRVRHIDTDLDHGRRDQHLDLTRHEALHHVVFFLETTMDQPKLQVCEHLFLESFVLCRRRLRGKDLGLLDQRADHKGLMSGAYLSTHKVVRPVSFVRFDDLGLHRRPSRWHLVDDRQRHLAV